MEYLVGLVIALVCGVFFYKNKADSAEVETNLAETKGRDRELAEQEALIQQAIKDLDDGILTIKKDKLEKDKSRKHLTLKERADEAKNRYKK